MNYTRHERHQPANSKQGFRVPRATAVLLTFLLLPSCGGGLELAPRANSPNGDTVVVSTLPPPAPPEEIPPNTRSQLVWTDGCWEWSMGRWIWVRGGWVEMPRGGAYFPGKMAVDHNAELIWSPCTWIVDGKPIGTLTPEVPARYPVAARSVAR